MNAYTVLLVMIGCEIEARPNDFWPNVGTTLFTRDDLHKEIWSKSDIALLTARQYFQKLIPPPALITVENEFVDKMLAYFRDTYTAVKNVSPDQEVDRIMTTALSDTVGGYLKLCVLPVTKLSFYGGIASYESAYKVFRFYTEIKKYLDTDGHSWRSPDQKTLNDFILNIPKFVRHKKQMINIHDSTLNEDPCTSFNYFEKSPKGLVVPMPVVNWDDVSMFLPIYNESTFSLDSPKHCNTLQNYYTKAKTCMNSKSKTVAADFDQKFQHWLSSDILPHLKDDRLYVALGNVLSLLNETREMCDVILNMYNSSSKHILPDFRSIVCSKTTIVVIIILVFELIWCIVAIDRLCCKKTEYSNDDDDDNDNSLRILSYFQTCNNRGRTSFRKRNTKERETQYTEMALKKPWFVRKWSGHSNYTEMDRDHFPVTVEAGCQKELLMKCDCPSTCIGTKCRSQGSFLYQVHSNDIFTIVNEKINDFSSPSPVPVMITNKSYTKIPSKGSNRQKCCACTKSMNFYDDSSSTITRTKNRSAVTIYQSEKSLEGSQIIYRSRQRKDLQTGNTESEYRRNEAVVELKPYCISDSYPNRNWKNASNVSIELVNKPSIKEVITRSSQEVPSITKKASTVSEMVITKIDKETETNVQKKDNLVNQSTSSVAVKRDKKLKQSQRKRYLEIKIERPKAEIKLGISAGQESPRKGHSKIPTQKSVKYVQSRKTRRPNEACGEILAYADKNIESVIKCTEQSTDYTEYQVRPEEDIEDNTPQNHVKNYNALKSTLLSTQDVTTTSNTSNTDIQSIMSQQEQCTITKSDEQHKSLMTIERSESDSSRKSLYTADVPLSCTNSKEDTIIENRNDASSIDQKTGKMAETERLIHTIYEHSKEALLSALATHEEKVVKEQNVQESCEIVMELTDGSETVKTESYNLNKCQTQTTSRKNPDSSVKGIKPNTNPEMLKLSKHQKDTEPVKKLNKQERRGGTVKTKTPKCNKDKPRTTLQPPKKSLAKWKTCVELKSCKQTNELAPTTKKSTYALKSDTYDGTTCKERKEDSSNCQTNLSATRKSKIPQLMRMDDTRVAKTLNTEVRLNLSI